MDGSLLMDWVSVGLGAFSPTLLLAGYIWRTGRKWDQRGNAIDRIIKTWEPVTWELSLNGFGRNRAAEPEELQGLSTRQLIVRLHEEGPAHCKWLEKHKAIAEGYITGGGSLLKGFHEWASKRFNIEIKRADPFRKVETPAFLSEILKNAGPEFSVALGVALRKLEETA